MRNIERWMRTLILETRSTPRRYDTFWRRSLALEQGVLAAIMVGNRAVRHPRGWKWQRRPIPREFPRFIASSVGRTFNRTGLAARRAFAGKAYD